MDDENPGPTNATQSAPSLRSQAPMSAPAPLVSISASPVPAPTPVRGFWDEVRAFFRRPEVIAVGAIALTVGVGVGVAIAVRRSERDDALSDGDSEPPWLPPPSDRDAQSRLRSATEQLAVNRGEGALFEELVGATLTDVFLDAEVLSQVSVRTPDGKARRVDFAIKNRNGSVTPVEVKNVPVLLLKHVEQAEDHRAGLKHSHGVRSGLPIVVVREDTIVSADLARRVRLIRHQT